MNREQWLRKRNQLEAQGMAPAFGAPNFAGQTQSLELSQRTSQEFTAIREQHFGDDLTGDEWRTTARRSRGSGKGSH